MQVIKAKYTNNLLGSLTHSPFFPHHSGILTSPFPFKEIFSVVLTLHSASGWSIFALKGLGLFY